MSNSDRELERFKTEINLTEYAASVGYAMNRRESGRNSVVMEAPSGDKIIVARGEDGHWIYFSVRDDADNGSIIDFEQKRQGGSLGHVRKTLRPWTGGGGPIRRPKPEAFAAKVEPSSKDRQAIIAAYGRMQATAEHPYLVSRAIGKEVQGDPRFAGMIRMDERRNAVFPHFDAEGLCGFEIKNQGFTGFAPGGEKGLWASHARPEDARLVIAESAIDALSYHALHPDASARYVSTAGAWSDKTRDLMRRAAEKLPRGEIVLAFDNDPQGRAYEAEARALLGGAAKPIRADFPPPDRDWNDELRASFPTATAGIPRETPQEAPGRPIRGEGRGE